MNRTLCTVIAPTVLIALMASSTGCANDIGGEWQSREKLSNGERNELFLDAEGGELDLHVVVGGAHQKIGFDAAWAALDEEDMWEVDLECADGCIEGMDLNLDLTCAHDGDTGHLDCEAEAPLRDYGYLEFERPGE